MVHDPRLIWLPLSFSLNELQLSLNFPGLQAREGGAIPFASGVSRDTWYPCTGKQVLFSGASGIFRGGENHKDFLT